MPAKIPIKTMSSLVNLKNILIFTIFIVLICTTGYFYYLYSQSTQKKVEKDAENTIDAVSKLMELPKDEVPTIATVTDKTKLAEQEFFRNAENGDKVLIYKNSKIAILYRPSIGKIISFAPVQETDAGQVAAQGARIDDLQFSNSPLTTGSVTPPSTNNTNKAVIVLFNGTSKTGATSTVEQLLLEKFDTIEIGDKDFANKRDYQKTIVVDVSGKFSPLAKDIAQEFNAEILSLPKEESQPTSADIVIIVGEDALK
ncbi:hypothetical protein A3H80_04970 [Candidatus Roizmanbacteria bacterium RIFCSPLOWO2_02_FULL_37_19]|uniref:LytR/CpsA/Psr regulator C-terminal domain-containing protein n=1 Tax=Candidatus Roizmanbacteria bacterium RIFCSPHIGHO2_02_FULL_37_24 TaxID=1802037 RepID=A0A1F7GYJ8_9BACT|nr:MAG: hypothetical protein A2862_04405 [Candidatus Roizmanbacteria bacterium RIFCSPHIGHO2_01_FULL_38_41]OGK24160.1 MAG: hypothetical protein A3C24_02715 [Candidatus Roizmanbacteria bacterium RIFCSPHIGHO2_02_FULL_37_24]OGK32051.1 MAG: hypothetical protein A3E10_04915 [Candidatus Roizmanbacteria bacterium RIFCSPHIGHO2_12_FULL_37_23]OGK55074.1 MAG: hypothetical protein A3H80_04970 [Candidatus Roizmanbacteria bacterium RIFCSPLOWO2_02_FULL_37_19]OGK59849.1 MAG: hypothetical protein A3G65_01055 [Ca